MAGGIITTGQHPKDLWPGIYQHFGMVYDEHTMEWPRLFDEATSLKNYEEVVQEVSFGLAPVKQQGQSVAYDSTIQGYVARWTHVAYGLGYIVTREELDDNLYLEVSTDRVKSLGISMRQTKENVAAGIFINAFSSSAQYAGPDGVSFINTAHPNTSGGTYSNRLAVDANLSEAALEDIAVQIMQATNDRGLLAALMPKSLHIAPYNYFNASRILKSMFQTQTANNDVNVIAANNLFPEGAYVNHYFTAPNAWFVRTNVAKGGLIHFNRVPIEFTQDNDFDTENAKAKAYERYSFFFADPRCAYGTSGS